MLFLCGFVMIAFASFLAGTDAWPYKIFKQYKMEHGLLYSQIFGMFLLPWIIMFFICDVKMAYNIIGFQNIIYANLMSFFFGIATILSTICMLKIGFVMISVLIGGTSLVIATLTPFIFKGSGIFGEAPDLTSPAGIISIAAVCFMVAAIFIISKSGELRDEQLGLKSAWGKSITKKKSNLYKCLAVVSGLMSPGLLFVNTYYGPIMSDAAKEAGCGEVMSCLSLWTFGMVGFILMCCSYSVFLQIKNRNARLVWCGKDFWASIASGVQYMVYLILFAFGTSLIGPLGAVIGNGVSQCVTIGGEQFVGFVSGEWKGVRGKPVKLFVCGIVILVIGIVLLTVSTYIDKIS